MYSGRQNYPTTQVEDSDLRIHSDPIGSNAGFDRNKSDFDENLHNTTELRRNPGARKPIEGCRKRISKDPTAIRSILTSVSVRVRSDPTEKE